jgi:adenosylmethionine-8-amino-7-oxononanoate aminotransferase
MEKSNETCNLECLKPLENLFDEKGNEIAAMIVEPLIQGAGGMRIYPPRYLKKLATITKACNVHLIFDEVATGFARTGRMFALEHADVTPDFLCLSKGMTGGVLPMAATMTTDEIYSAFYAPYSHNKTFYHGHTFTGNPLSASAALGSLQVFENEKPLQRMTKTVPHLHKKMEQFRDLPWVGDVRCLGMICALELVKNKETKEEFSFEDRVGWQIYLEGLKKGLILRPIGNVIYLWLPVSATLEEINEITERMFQVLNKEENIHGWRA